MRFTGLLLIFEIERMKRLRGTERLESDSKYN